MRKILVVDDDPAIIRLLSAVLRYEAMKVVSLPSGAEALETLEREKPDIVLLDYDLPGMNGIEVCRQIKANPLTAATPVIIMTGKLPRAEWEQLRAQGADGFMQKPFSVKQLLDLMDELTPQQP